MIDTDNMWKKTSVELLFQKGIFNLNNKGKGRCSTT